MKIRRNNQKIALALDCNPKYLPDGRPEVGNGTDCFQTGSESEIRLILKSSMIERLSEMAADQNKTLEDLIEDTLFWLAMDEMEAQTETEDFIPDILA